MQTRGDASPGEGMRSRDERECAILLATFGPSLSVCLFLLSISTRQSPAAYTLSLQICLSIHPSHVCAGRSEKISSSSVLTVSPWSNEKKRNSTSGRSATSVKEFLACSLPARCLTNPMAVCMFCSNAESLCAPQTHLIRPAARPRTEPALSVEIVSEKARGWVAALSCGVFETDWADPTNMEGKPVPDSKVGCGIMLVTCPFDQGLP